MRIHRLTRDQLQFFFDRHTTPVQIVDSGDEVIFETERADNMWIEDETFVFRDREQVMMTKGGPNPVTGPVFVTGAEPGDILAIDFLEVICAPDGSPGYVTTVPGPAGLVAPYSVQDDLQPETMMCRIEGNTVTYPAKHRVVALPLAPMVGTIGVAPIAERRASYWNGQEFHGNTDCPEATTDRTLLVRVNVPGALLSIGDVHAAQGDGEISGCAVECRGEVRVRVRVIHRESAEYGKWPQLESPRWIGSIGCTLTSLGDAAQAAYRDLVFRLESFHGYERMDAYHLVAQVGLLRVCQMTHPHYTCLAMIDRKYLRN